MSVLDYADTEPHFDLFEYFNGTSHATGVFLGRDGSLKRQFTVAIQGTIAGNQLTLVEDFDYDDGEQSQRIWVIEQTGPGEYSGRADDVIGTATGTAAGAVLNWQYDLELPYNDSTIRVHFDDWMYLQKDQVLINRAKVSKFGFRVGEVILSFRRVES